MKYSAKNTNIVFAETTQWSFSLPFSPTKIVEAIWSASFFIWIYSMFSTIDLSKGLKNSVLSQLKGLKTCISLSKFFCLYPAVFCSSSPLISNTTLEFGIVKRFGMIIPAVLPRPGGATTSVESGLLALKSS